MSGYTVRIGYPRSQAFSATGCSGTGETSAVASIGMILEAKRDQRLNCIEEAPRPVAVKQDVTEPEAEPAETAPENLFANDPAYEPEVLRPKQGPKKQEPKSPGKFVTWIRKQTKKVGEAAEGAFDSTMGGLFDDMK
jgi:hypothetical protein